MPPSSRRDSNTPSFLAQTFCFQITNPQPLIATHQWKVSPGTGDNSLAVVRALSPPGSLMSNTVQSMKGEANVRLSSPLGNHRKCCYSNAMTMTKQPSALLSKLISFQPVSGRFITVTLSPRIPTPDAERTYRLYAPKSIPFLTLLLLRDSCEALARPRQIGFRSYLPVQLPLL